MKYNIFIDQKGLQHLAPELDVVDATILCFIIDCCYHPTGMVRRKFDKKSYAWIDGTAKLGCKIEKKSYTWIDYDNLVKELPILKIKSRMTVYRRIKRLVDAELIDKKVKRLNRASPIGRIEMNRQCFFRVTDKGKRLRLKPRKILGKTWLPKGGI